MVSEPLIQRGIFDSQGALANAPHRYIYFPSSQVMDDVEKVMQYVHQDLIRKKLYQKMVFLLRTFQLLQYLLEQ